MQVSVYKEVAVETTVDVDLDDVIAEQFEQLKHAEDFPKRSLAIVDSTTRILAAIPDAVLENASPEAVSEAIKRLRVQLKRWQRVALERLKRSS